jgi:hypothetical protein
MKKYFVTYMNPVRDILTGVFELGLITEEMLIRPRFERGGPEQNRLDVAVQEQIKGPRSGKIQVIAFSELAS